MIYDLCSGDIAKLKNVEKIDYITVTEWYYVKRVNDLNALLDRIYEWKKIKK